MGGIVARAGHTPRRAWETVHTRPGHVTHSPSARLAATGCTTHPLWARDNRARGHCVVAGVRVPGGGVRGCTYVNASIVPQTRA